MNRYIYALLLALTCSMTAQAQRMLPKQKGLEVNVGTLSDEKPGRNYYGSVALTIYGKKGSYWLWALEYNHEYGSYKQLRIPLETYLAEAGYSLQLLGDGSRTVTLNGALSAVAGYETINRGKAQLYDGAIILNKEGFIYGAGGRLSLEIYLCDRVVLLLQARTKALWGTSREQLRPSAGLGLRFNF